MFAQQVCPGYTCAADYGSSVPGQKTCTKFADVAKLVPTFRTSRRQFLRITRGPADCLIGLDGKEVHPTKAYLDSWMARILSLKNS